MHKVAALILACVCLVGSTTGASAEDYATARAEANRLAVEARQAWNKAREVEGSERKAALETALEKLRLIVERYPSTDRAVDLIGGGEVAGISIPQVEAALERDWANGVVDDAEPPIDKPKKTRKAKEPAGTERAITVTLGDSNGRAHLGVLLEAMPKEWAESTGLDETSGALVVKVYPGTAAEQMDLKPGDVILEVDGQHPKERWDVMHVVWGKKPGAQVELRLWRFSDAPGDLRAHLADGVDEGDTASNVTMGIALRQGIDGDIDEPAALNLFEIAGEDDNAEAHFQAGQMHLTGKGTSADPAEAARRLKIAAEAGHIGAATLLASLYESGRGVKKSLATARQWYEVAANKGGSSAMFKVATLYEKGIGGAKDMAKAREWYEKSARNGSAQAMFNLGRFYETGAGGRKSIAAAQRWYAKAAAKGHLAAVKRLER